MAADQIRRAMTAGKRWAARQLKAGTEITPFSAEAAAQRYSRHRGSQHLFIISALEVLFEAESVAGLATGTTHKAVS